MLWTIFPLDKYDLEKVLTFVLNVKESGQILSLLDKLRYCKKIKNIGYNIPLLVKLKSELENKQTRLKNILDNVKCLKIFHDSLFEIKNQIEDIDSFLNLQEFLHHQANEYFEKTLKPLLNKLNSLHIDFYHQKEALKDIGDLLKGNGGRFSEKISFYLKKDDRNDRLEGVIKTIIETNKQLTLLKDDDVKNLLAENKKLILQLEEIIFSNFDENKLNQCYELLEEKIVIEENLSVLLNKDDKKVLREMLRDKIISITHTYEEKTQKLERYIKEKEEFIKRIEGVDFQYTQDPKDIRVNIIKTKRKCFSLVSKIKYKNRESKKLKIKNEDKQILTDELEKLKEMEYMDRQVLNEINYSKKINEKLQIYKRKHSQFISKDQDITEQIKIMKQSIAKNIKGFPVDNKKRNQIKDNLENILLEINVGELTICDNKYDLSDLYDSKDSTKKYLRVIGLGEINTVDIINGGTEVRFKYSNGTFGNVYNHYDKIYDTNMSAIFTDLKSPLEKLTKGFNLMLISYGGDFTFYKGLMSLTLNYVKCLEFFTNVMIQIFQIYDDNNIYNIIDQKTYTNIDDLPMIDYSKIDLDILDITSQFFVILNIVTKYNKKVKIILCNLKTKSIPNIIICDKTIKIIYFHIQGYYNSVTDTELESITIDMLNIN